MTIETPIETNFKEIIPEISLDRLDILRLSAAYGSFISQAQSSPPLDRTDVLYRTFKQPSPMQKDELQNHAIDFMQKFDDVLRRKLYAYAQAVPSLSEGESIDIWDFGPDQKTWHIVYHPGHSMMIMKRQEYADYTEEDLGSFAGEEYYFFSMDEEPHIEIIDRTVSYHDFPQISIDGERFTNEAAFSLLEYSLEELDRELDKDRQPSGIDLAYFTMARLIYNEQPYLSEEESQKLMSGMLLLYGFLMNLLETSPDEVFDNGEELAWEYMKGLASRLDDSLPCFEDFGIELEHDHASERRVFQVQTLKRACQAFEIFTFQSQFIAASEEISIPEIGSKPSFLSLSWLVEEVKTLHMLGLLGESIGPHITMADVQLSIDHQEITYLTEILYALGVFNRLFFQEDLEKMAEEKKRAAFLESWRKNSYDPEKNLYIYWPGHKTRNPKELKGHWPRGGTEVRYFFVLDDDWDSDLELLLYHYRAGSLAIRAFQKDSSERTQQEQMLADDWSWYMQEWRKLLNTIHVKELPDDKRYIILTEEEADDLGHTYNNTVTDYDRFVTSIFLASSENIVFQDAAIHLTLSFYERVRQHIKQVA